MHSINAYRQFSTRRNQRYVLLVVLINGLGLLVDVGSAAAATSPPVAIGAGDQNDNRVMEADGTAVDSLIYMRSYRAGSDASVATQRWQFELLTSTATSFTYRIQNAASNRCLDVYQATILYINDCSSAQTQRWVTSTTTDPFGGWVMKNERTLTCFSVNGGSLAENTRVFSAGCYNSWYNRFRLRTAPHDCTVRSRDWARTEICATIASARMNAVVANWRHDPMSLTWLDPNRYVLTHTANTYVTMNALDGQGLPGYTGVELGIRAERSIDASGVTSYDAYWVEWGNGQQQYHLISAADAPGSDTPNGRNHTYLIESRGDTGPWDVFYDYNRVGTTSQQASGSTRSVRTGLAVRYPQATAINSLTSRMQWRDGNGQWRRPYLEETGTGDPKACEAPPRYEDYNYPQINLPPWCFTSSYTTRPSAIPGQPTEVDSFTVSKPGVLAAPAAATRATVLHSKGTLNGVDQKSLASCLERGVADCRGEVPGLGACVNARLPCNATSDTAASARIAETARTRTQVEQAAQRTFAALPNAATAVDVRTLNSEALIGPAREAIHNDGKMSRPVYAVSSSATVHGLAKGDDSTYQGYVAIYDASGNDLLYACLGKDCAGTGR